MGADAEEQENEEQLEVSSEHPFLLKIRGSRDMQKTHQAYTDSRGDDENVYEIDNGEREFHIRMS